MAAMMSLQRFRFSASFRTWLTGIVRHKVVDYYRARGRRGEMISLEAHGVPTTCSKESYSEVRLAVAELPAHYQEVLLLRFAEDLPFQEIAAMLGLSLEATKSRYRRAVRAFAKAYGGNGQE